MDSVAQAIRDDAIVGEGRHQDGLFLRDPAEVGGIDFAISARKDFAVTMRVGLRRPVFFGARVKARLRQSIALIRYRVAPVDLQVPVAQSSMSDGQP